MLESDFFLSQLITIGYQFFHNLLDFRNYLIFLNLKLLLILIIWYIYSSSFYLKIKLEATLYIIIYFPSF